MYSSLGIRVSLNHKPSYSNTFCKGSQHLKLGVKHLHIISMNAFIFKLIYLIQVSITPVNTNCNEIWWIEFALRWLSIGSIELKRKVCYDVPRINSYREHEKWFIGEQAVSTFVLRRVFFLLWTKQSCLFSRDSEKRDDLFHFGEQHLYWN